MHQIARIDRDHQPDDEGRVGGPPKQLNARQHVVHQPEDRGVPAERVDEAGDERDQEKADLAGP